MTSFSGRRVLVVGLGVSGYAAAEALLDQGATVRVTEAGTSAAMEERATVLRSRGAAVELGGHDLEHPGHPGNSDCDLAVVSPGIPPSSEIITALRSTEVELIGEIELAYRLAECDFLAVTGTNGKTTTTALLAAILAEGGIDSMAAGNIGTPVVEAVKKIGKGGAIALEVSSFQLSTITTFRPKVAVVLNVAEDHTDWHGSFEAYAADKARITENQTAGDVFMPNIEDPIAAKMVKGTRATTVPFSATRIPEGGIGVTSGKVMWRGREIFMTDDSALSGVAGLEDSIAAAGAALEYGVDPRAVLRAIKSFQPLGHRLEVVAEIGGVTFINDSKATNPHATLAAVKGLEDVVLIA
ncbi:MAG: UDP-N-acetylmuramoyl-L-alanine--D-glutamate ligase, partial [Actinomycetota bacterium]